MRAIPASQPPRAGAGTLLQFPRGWFLTAGRACVGRLLAITGFIARIENGPQHQRREKPARELVRQRGARRPGPGGTHQRARGTPGGLLRGGKRSDQPQHGTRLAVRRPRVHHLVPRPPHDAVPGKPQDAGPLHRRDDRKQDTGDGAAVRVEHHHVQKKLGETSPLENASVRFALQRMHRRRGRRQTQVHGLTWPLRNRLLNAAGDRLIDARNRALLGVGYDTLLRRSELVALRVEDVLEEMDGSATVLLRAGKTDAEGCGTSLFLARDTVELVSAWRQRGRVGDGRLFRGIGRHGRLHEKLDGSQVPRIYKQMARQAGLPDEIVEALGGHSTRVGRGTGHDRLRHRAARDPAVRPLEDHPHGPALRRTAAGQTQRRRPARRTPETLTLSRGFETRSGGA